MCTRISTKQKLLGQLEDGDSILRDISEALTRRSTHLNFEPLVELLIEKDKQIKETVKEVEVQLELHNKIEALRLECAKSDQQIVECQMELKKSEVLLSTALYYSRQKLESMATAVNNPIDMEELVRFSHRIGSTHGVTAPDNWEQGDPRRPYPNQEEIRRGYLGHLDDSGNFRPSVLDAISEITATAANLQVTSMTLNPSSTLASTPGQLSVSHGCHQAHGTVGSHPADSSLPCSPNMILPGVNMVSSPAVPLPSNTVPAGGVNPGSVGATSHAISSGSRLPTALASMLASPCGLLDSGRVSSGVGNGTIPPRSLPHARTTGGALPQPVSSSARPGSRTSGTAYRSASSNSPGAVGLQPAPNSMFGESPVSFVGVATPPKGAQTHRSRHKHQQSQRQTEVMSSDTSTESSSGEDWHRDGGLGPGGHGGGTLNFSRCPR